VGYYPTAGTGDYVAPTYVPTTTSGGTLNYPAIGSKQDAGWAFQLLPYIDAEPIWYGGSNSSKAATALVANALKAPLQTFTCPSRRTPAGTVYIGYTNAAYPSQAQYSTLLGSKFTVSQIDYAGCNGNATPGATVGTPGSGIIVSMSVTTNTITATDVNAGYSYTLMLGEKAANPRLNPPIIANEDDQGYASGFATTNFNNIRFTAASLLPLRDHEVSGPTGGAFGSAHPSTWNALMADGSVQALSYTIDSTIFSGLGTISGREIITDADLTP
jgi:hypothetical protein